MSIVEQEASAKQSPASFIHEQAEILSAQLTSIRELTYPPESRKTLAPFRVGEAAKILGVSANRLRTLDPSAFSENMRDERGNRIFTLESIHQARKYLSEHGQKGRHGRILPQRTADEKMQVICVANFKGGSAKTTTSTHLAQSLAMRGLRVLAIDLDPQASLSSMFGILPELDLEPNSTLYGAIRYDDERVPLKDLIHKTYFHNLDLVPGALELMEYEHQTPNAIARGEAAGDDIFFRSIHNAVQSVSDDYDVVIFDAPPQLGYLSLGALFAANGVLITVHPAMLDISSMNQFLNMLGDLVEVVEGYGVDMGLDFFNYVLTRYNPNDKAQINCATLLRSLFEDRVLAHPVLESTAIANAALENKTIYEIARGMVSSQALSRAIESVDSVNTEVFNILEHTWGRDV